MDNKQDRQFYWEVKDFMNKNANPQPSNSSKPKITDAVKNILEQNNPYTQKSFNNKSEYIPHVQNTIKVVSESEKGYEQNCKAFTKNKDVNAFQQAKLIHEGIVTVPGGGTRFVPDTPESGLVYPEQPILMADQQAAANAAAAAKREVLNKTAEMLSLGPNDPRRLAHEAQVRARAAPQAARQPAPQAAGQAARQTTPQAAGQAARQPAPQATSQATTQAPGAKPMSGKAKVARGAAEFGVGLAVALPMDIALQHGVVDPLAAALGIEDGSAAKTGLESVASAASGAGAEAITHPAIQSFTKQPLNKKTYAKAVGIGGAAGFAVPWLFHAGGKAWDAVFGAPEEPKTTPGRGMEPRE